MRFIQKDGYKILDREWLERRNALKLEDFSFKPLSIGVFQITYRDPKTKKRYTAYTSDVLVMGIIGGSVTPTEYNLKHLRKIAKTSSRRVRLPQRMYCIIRGLNMKINSTLKKFGKEFRAVDAHGMPFTISPVMIVDGEIHYETRFGFSTGGRKIPKRVKIRYKINGEDVIRYDVFEAFVEEFKKSITRGKNLFDSLQEQLK